MIEFITKDVWIFCIVPFFSAREYCKCFRVSVYISRVTQLGIEHRKHLVLRGNQQENEHHLLWLFAKYAKSLRVIDVRLSEHACVDTMCDLIRGSPRLEAFMASSADDRVLDSLVQHCPDLIALALCTRNFSLCKLQRFKHLKALELGSPREPMSMKPESIAGVINRHPYIVIVHILNLRNTPELLGAVNPDTIRSFSCPYDRDCVTPLAIRRLRRFHHLDNLNLGESVISESVVAAVAVSCPGLTKFSVSPKAFLSESLRQLGDGETFQNLKVLGCRTPPTRDATPARLSAFSDIGSKRDWCIVDYSMARPVQRDHWCREPFEFMTLLGEYNLISKF